MRYRKANCNQNDSSATQPNQADNILNRAFASSKDDDLGTETLFSALRTRIEMHAATQPKERPIMSNIYSKITSHPQLSIGVASCLVALALMALVPVSCTETTGYAVDVIDDAPQKSTLSITPGPEMTLELQKQPDGADNGLPFDPDKLKEALVALGHKDVELLISDEGDHHTIKLTNLNSHLEAREAAAALLQLTGIDGRLLVSPVKEKVSATLFDHIFDRLLNISVDSDGKTDEEIEAEIRARLEENGMTDFDVQFRTMGEGKKMIFIGEGTDGSPVFDTLNQIMEWQVEDESDGSPKSINLDNLQGSPDEIKQQILDQLKAQGMDTANIKIRKVGEDK